MKRALLLAALLTSSTGLAAKAQDAAPLFNIQQTSPSVIEFTGTGTAQFNSSKGVNNQFNVGSSTNLGVNASVSATEGFTPSATAQLDLSRGSQLQQTIGSSGNAANEIAIQSSAYNSAFSAANSSKWGASFEAYQASPGNSSTTAAEWQAGWEGAYNQAYTAAVTNTQSSEAINTSDGIIRGTFTTSEGAASAANSNSTSSDWSNSAQASAQSEWGVEYNPNETYGVGISSESDWQAAYDNSYNTAYRNAAASSAYNTTSTVEVAGLGSISTVNAAETSTFTVDLQGSLITGGGTATANGSAGASLSSSSFATQNTASTASAFIQAFGGN